MKLARKIQTEYSLISHPLTVRLTVLTVIIVLDDLSNRPDSDGVAVLSRVRVDVVEGGGMLGVAIVHGHVDGHGKVQLQTSPDVVKKRRVLPKNTSMPYVYGALVSRQNRKL